MKDASQKGFFICFCLAAICYGSAVSAQENPRTMDQSRLPQILQKTAEYCERLKGMALNFVCIETIREVNFSFVKKTATRLYPGSKATSTKVGSDLVLSSSKKNTFVYDFQMIKKGEEFKEKRTLLEENGKKTKVKNVSQKTMRLSAKYLVFGPVGFLSEYWQPFFRYEIIGTEKLGRKKALVIRASPKEPREENYYFGKIWIDEADSSILKIEWEPLADPDFHAEIQSDAGTLERKLSWIVTYDVIKKGIRFPGQQMIREAYLTPIGRTHTKYMADYSYGNYKFFTVETEVKIK